MIFKNFYKSTFVSGFSVALVLLCFSATPSLASDSRIAVSKNVITFTCVPFKSIKKNHFKKILKEIKKAKKVGNAISKIKIEECLMASKTMEHAKRKLSKVESGCRARTIDRNCDIELEIEISGELATYVKDFYNAARTIQAGLQGPYHKASF